MFPGMRRAAQQLSEAETRAVLERGTVGVLSVLSPSGYPYGVPLNYVFLNGSLYFHCAREGHKLDAVAWDGRACFTVIDTAEVVGARYTTRYRSVIAFGKAEVVEEETERTAAFLALTGKYSGMIPAETREQKVRACTRSAIVRLTVEHVTGKASASFHEGHEN
jgi:Predicted flavin-nucleotide-binding protein